MKIHKNILIISGNGMMGNTIYKFLNSKKLNVFYTVRSLSKLIFKKKFLIINNISKKDNLKKIKLFIKTNKISLIINCCGVTKHEKHSYQKKYAFKVNASLNHNLSKIKNTKLLILSSDCVFDGKKGNYVEKNEDYGPDIYSLSKRKGEITNKKNVITFRSSGVGHEINSKKGILEWFLKSKNKSVQGYSKAIFTGPTTLEIGKIIYNFVLNDKVKYGLYHVGSKKISKYELLQIFKKIYKKKISIKKENNFKINRSLNCTKFKNLTNYISPNWIDLIKETKIFNEKFSKK